jgi:hypothetical protein
MSKFLIMGVVAAGLAGTIAPAFAQTVGGSLVATTKASPGCPATGLHIVREGNNLSGVAYRVDKSGYSSIDGTTSRGKFSFVQTSISGNGPTGEVVGTVTHLGALKAVLVGTKCSFTTTLPMLDSPGG